MIFAINGREYPNLFIIDYSVKLETLDGEGTGRTKAVNWPMIRDPQGTIINLSLEFGTSNSKEPDFVHLWGVCKSMGKTDFVSVKFMDPTGSIIEQYMYLVASDLRYKRIYQEDDIVITDTLSISFIAQKGM